MFEVGRENLTSLPVADHDGQKPSEFDLQKVWASLAADLIMFIGVPYRNHSHPNREWYPTQCRKSSRTGSGSGSGTSARKKKKVQFFAVTHE